ncbi:putative dihydroorotate dehydrogenase protein [Zalerion maritima]|uniref:Dihydroorotate dehydrogenase protein n=1 Tax=Zalerion maritima TaxID=339359 RepID=A0AAD5WVG6_9PEZI|nr:putative dihydroorotate dehydrogenase protein [Zalerion maritima]
MSSPYFQAARSFSSPLTYSIRPRLRTIRPRKVPRRHESASSTSKASEASASTPPPPPTGLSLLRPILYTSLAALVGTGAYLYATDTRAAIHRFIVPRLLRVFLQDAEDAHDFGTQVLKALYLLNLHPRERTLFPLSSGATDDEAAALSISVHDSRLANPIGISAGLDKHADIPDALFALGAAVVEVGGCTPLPQGGNPRPRVFRIPTLDAMINRYGLNSKGADVMAIQLRNRVRKFARDNGLTEDEVLNGEGGAPPGALHPGRMLCVQIAKNKDTDEKDLLAVARDYVYCVKRLAPYADVLVVNVSSPNTPGLRDLQAVGPLSRILAAVVEEARATDRKTKPKVMVKVSPDEDEDTQMEGIVQAVWMSGVDGVIVGNTTKKRSGLVPSGVQLTPKEKQALGETGGYSGPQMFGKTLDLVGRYRKMLDGVYKHSDEGDPKAGKSADPGQKVIFATGGITTGDQALRILQAGASVAMVYTGLVYGGSGTVTRMKSEMRQKLSEGKKKE